MTEQRRITLSNYAQQMGVSYKTAWRWWKQGRLMGEQLQNGSIWIDESMCPEQDTDGLKEQLKIAAQEREELRNLLYEVLAQLQELQGTPEPNPWPSEVGMDYSHLVALLGAGSSQEANEYTWLLLLALAGYEEGDTLGLEEMEALPRTDMETIDWLWYEYSEGRFGFGVQEWIWEECDRHYEVFCDRIGWRIQSKWLSTNQLRFSLSAPVGHLPAIIWRNRACYGLGYHSPEEVLETLFSFSIPSPQSGRVV
ncbi:MULTISPECIES: GUN4 domain-containing protein [unclassified Roseofilum]|uniref:GUN4 domain-containing protein n=1 Tax=unclassified Roseofilum TaxID=2620099 RepID=UPI001B05B4AD|nr:MULTISPECIES: GUN4 domain-containing protein [unclassified Roseofilum]MBP0010713.1 GUN4 domain-containing protein [Roseofilum sp. Belize Diploria]MBP0035331.1 GUN4 domain-containing protein [Roseofilum sp. Belize BBD 4]